MIKKVLKIKNIGKYDTESANADLSFGVRTVIFGANKAGKTTFVSILKSLKEGKAFYIKSRKTFGTSPEDAQECEILFGDGKKSTYNSDWSCDSLEIFDNDFIHKNVFMGDKIEQDHKTQLHKILIDEENLKLQEKIDTEEKNYAKLLGDKEAVKRDIGLNFDEFIKLTEKDEVKDVVVKLKENQDKQKQYYNQVRLNQLKSSTKLSFDFDAFEANIKQDIDSNLEEKIKDHIKTCWGNDSKDVDFLNIGVNKISEEKNLCPFCGQNLDSVSDLISDMKNYFGEAYKKTQSSINDSIARFKMIDFQKEIAQFKAEGFEFLTQFNDQSLSNDFKVILGKLEQKQKDLSTDIKLEELGEYKEYKKVIMAMSAEVKSLKAESIIYNLSYPSPEQIGQLEDKGIELISAIPEDLALRDKQKVQIQTTRDDKKIIDKDKIKPFLGTFTYPLYFFDYETFSSVIPFFDGCRPYADYPFQYSLHVLESADAELKHVEYLHNENSNPMPGLIKQLKDDIGDTGTILTWNMSYEKGCNDRMAEFYPEHKEFLVSVNERIEDLMIPFSKMWFFDKDFMGSASVKKVMPVLAPELSYKELNVGDGLLARRQWTETVLEGKNSLRKTEIMYDLSKYCTLDTLAMVRILEELRKI